jgi:hypothetical protein
VAYAWQARLKPAEAGELRKYMAGAIGHRQLKLVANTGRLKPTLPVGHA